MNSTKTIHTCLLAAVGAVIVARAVYNYLYTTKENFYTGISGFISVAATAMVLVLTISVVSNLAIGLIKKKISIKYALAGLFLTTFVIISLGYLNNQIWEIRVQ